MKRNLTKAEEKVIRLNHHDFKGLTINETARILQVQPAHVRDLLRSVKQKAPQLFPILTPRQVAVLRGYENKASQEVIAAGLGVAVKSVKRIVTFLRKHKFLVNKPKVIAYTPLQDGQIVQKF